MQKRTVLLSLGKNGNQVDLFLPRATSGAGRKARKPGQIGPKRAESERPLTRSGSIGSRCERAAGPRGPIVSQGGRVTRRNSQRRVAAVQSQPQSWQTMQAASRPPASVGEGTHYVRAAPGRRLGAAETIRTADRQKHEPVTAQQSAPQKARRIATHAMRQERPRSRHQRPGRLHRHGPKAGTREAAWRHAPARPHRPESPAARAGSARPARPSAASGIDQAAHPAQPRKDPASASAGRETNGHAPSRADHVRPIRTLRTAVTETPKRRANELRLSPEQRISATASAVSGT